MANAAKIVLFDIDKTLMIQGRLHAESFSAGFERVYSVHASTKEIDTNGMTDQQIIIEVLRKHGFSDRDILAKMEDCKRAIVDFFQANKSMLKVSLLPGVRELLAELEGRGFLIGSVTGNLEPIARAKFDSAGIAGYFSFGGFGSDDPERWKLVRLAIERSGAGPGTKAFLIGDTPLDVKAGLKAGVTTIAVATGAYSESELSNSGAHHTIPDMSDTAAVIRLLG